MLSTLAPQFSRPRTACRSLNLEILMSNIMTFKSPNHWLPRKRNLLDRDMKIFLTIQLSLLIKIN